MEQNRTPNFVQSIRFCSSEYGNRTQSNTIQWIAFDVDFLCVNKGHAMWSDCLLGYYWEKKIRIKLFTELSGCTMISWGKVICSQYVPMASLLESHYTYQVMEAFTGHRDSTTLCWRWPNCPHSLTSEKVQSLLPIKTFLHVKVALLVVIYYTAHLKPFLWDCWDYEKHVLSKNLLLIFNTTFTKIKC